MDTGSVYRKGYSQRVWTGSAHTCGLPSIHRIRVGGAAGPHPLQQLAVRHGELLEHVEVVRGCIPERVFHVAVAAPLALLSKAVVRSEQYL